MTTLRPVTRRHAGVALLALVAVLGPDDHAARSPARWEAAHSWPRSPSASCSPTARRGSINFANAATATYAAYVFNGLRREGELFLPPLPNPLSLLEGVAARAGRTQVGPAGLADLARRSAPRSPSALRLP